MSGRLRRLWLSVLVALPALSAAAGEDRDPALARRARQVLRQYCHKCHGATFKVPGFDVLGREALLTRRGPDETPYLVPGRPDASLIWRMVGVENEMPPRRQPQPTVEDKETLRDWIAAGAPAAGEESGEIPAPGDVASPTSPFLAEPETLRALRDYLRETPEDDRPFKRFFTLTVPYNLARLDRTAVKSLPYYRAALSKLVNSLSRERDIVLPQAIDRRETIYVIDLRVLGWDRPDLWRVALADYPFGMIPGTESALELHREVAAMAGTPFPAVRGDWFIAAASRAPLYYKMLRVPDDARALEAELKVDVRADFLQGRSIRAGLLNSGVSRQNRLVERHRTPFGAYWKSYDFAGNDGERDLARRPLGPAFAGHPFPDGAFRHDGGEILFNLPNGLQGYLLVNRDDKRLDQAPTEIVEDPSASSGSSAIVAGVSCMKCHRRGVIGGFKDVLRESFPVGSEERRKLRQLHPSDEALDAFLLLDRKRYLAAQDEATGPFLRALPEAGDGDRSDLDVIGAVAEDYRRDLSADAIAVELNQADLGRWRVRLADLAIRPALGLAPLGQGAKIARAKWDSPGASSLSMYQEVAAALGHGTPSRSR